MRDVRLTQLPNGRLDILLEDGKTAWADDGIQAAQHCVMRLMKIKGESVTDNPNEDATDWYGIIFRADKSRAEKELHLKKRIMGTPGIKKIISFSWAQTQRSVSIDARVMTDWGEQTISAALEPF
jgi:hypothetical protein